MAFGEQKRDLAKLENAVPEEKAEDRFTAAASSKS